LSKSKDEYLASFSLKENNLEIFEKIALSLITEFNHPAIHDLIAEFNRPVYEKFCPGADKLRAFLVEKAKKVPIKVKI
jgi:hypothetical protein